ncbi:metal-sensing transcriptional repressor [Micromonospora globbae]|uniref:Uncharacterized protein n=1 Tax=Micromonospora globbae TaxID=1894969 RepID=A0A420ECC0_9ACTN|nr:hypothetical protein D7I43_32325 [Micromonospora globbae]
MYEDGRHSIEILDQLAATRGALDAVALLVLDEFTASAQNASPTPRTLNWQSRT